MTSPNVQTSYKQKTEPGYKPPAPAELKKSTSVKKFEQHLKTHGLDAAAVKFLEGMAGKEGKEAYFSAALRYASSNPKDLATICGILENGPDDIEFMISVLKDTQDLSATKFVYSYFKGKANYDQVLSQAFQNLSLEDVDGFYSQAGVQDNNHNGTIEKGEAGYGQLISRGVDQDKNGVIDLAEIAVHLFDGEKTKDAQSFSQTIAPLRDSLYTAMSHGYDVSAQGAQYESALNLVLSGNYPQDVKATALWLLTDHQAHQAADKGDFRGALDTYEAYAQETGHEPGGLYEQLKANEDHLVLLEAYHGVYQEHGKSDYGSQPVGGLEFLHGALVTGKVFNKKKNKMAKIFLSDPGIAKTYGHLFRDNNKGSTTTVLSPTTVAKGGAFMVKVDQPPRRILLNGQYLSISSRSSFDISSQTWTVTIPEADIAALIPEENIEVVLTLDAKDKKIADITLPHLAGVPKAQSASIENVQGRILASLANGEPVTSVAVVAPDTDDMVSWAMVKRDGGFKGVSFKKLYTSFIKKPQYVAEPDRAQVLVAGMKKCKSKAEVIAYVEANFTGQEQLRFFRQADLFIGGGMGPYQHLAAEGYTITSIDYPKEGDPCILRLHAEKRIPIKDLTGAMAEGFAALPQEVQDQYRAQGGIPVQTTVEIYSTTGDAFVAYGHHLAGKEAHAVGFVTHAPTSKINGQLLVESGSVTPNISDEPVANILVCCHAENFDTLLSNLYGPGVYHAPRIGKPFPGIAHFSIFTRVLDAAVTGESMMDSAQAAYTFAAGGGGNAKRAYVDKPVSVASFHDVFNPNANVTRTITGEYIVDGRVIKPNNTKYGYFAALSNVEIAIPGKPAQIPEIEGKPNTVVAKAVTEPATPSVNVAL
ncbi:hypothetical protein ACFL37_01560 [Candidatus Margulisiibacteriota bacterium]